jgi:hypothetical protein
MRKFLWAVAFAQNKIGFMAWKRERKKDRRELVYALLKEFPSGYFALLKY